MTGWIVFGVIVLLLILLMLVRLGGEVTYGGEGLKIRVRLGRIWITLIPKKKEKQKKDKKSRHAKAKPPKQKANRPGARDPGVKRAEEPEEEKKGGLPIYLIDLIKLAADTVGRLLKKLQIDRLEMEYVFGGKTDPAGAAIRYGGVYAGGGALLPLLENTFCRIKRRELQAWIDYKSDETLVWLRFGLSIRIGQLLAIGWHLGWAFLRAYRNKQQEDNEHGTKESDQ